MKRLLVSLLGVLALVLPLSAGPSHTFDRGFSFAPTAHRVGVQTGPVSIESFTILKWPDPGDFRKGERDLDDKHTCKFEFLYSNRDLDRDWKCRYTVTVRGKNGIYARLEKTETLDRGKVGRRNSFGVKLRTHEYKLADSVDIRFELWRKD